MFFSDTLIFAANIAADVIKKGSSFNDDIPPSLKNEVVSLLKEFNIEPFGEHGFRKIVPNISRYDRPGVEL
jgi:hypothetical protein